VLVSVTLSMCALPVGLASGIAATPLLYGLGVWTAGQLLLSMLARSVVYVRRDGTVMLQLLTLLSAVLVGALVVWWGHPFLSALTSARDLCLLFGVTGGLIGVWRPRKPRRMGWVLATSSALGTILLARHFLEA